MSAIVTGRVHRRPFRPDALAELVAFASRHPVAFIDARSFQEDLRRMTSGPDSVIDVLSGSERVAVAVAYDRLGEPADAILAALVAARENADWGAVSELVVDGAMQAARAAGKPNVTITWREPLPVDVAAVFARRGYRPILEECRMTRRAGVVGDAPELPAGLRWRDVGPDQVPTSLALLAEAFAGTPSFLPGEDELAALLTGEQHRSRLLCDGDRAAGFLRVAFNPAQRIGYVGPIARHPSDRGRGLGTVLLVECLALLSPLAPVQVCLDVLASNVVAMELYLRHGFRVERRVGYYRGNADPSLWRNGT
jgi:ribosomal protein S18 acetylase RimI-like enzyme